ncbi:hypothetical protein QAD02_000823 [Eretmocerus hayati]|uniref:Uncharacterized protein n=1 Tax=Eretmocerus hayati TaxID=131215 RepID=A0ACC2NEA3_9HYME|nr:hypothetical protein QAD02_000823 [Eretmocerus hayati]
MSFKSRELRVILCPVHVEAGRDASKIVPSCRNGIRDGLVLSMHKVWVMCVFLFDLLCGAESLISLAQKIMKFESIGYNPITLDRPYSPSPPLGAPVNLAPNVQGLGRPCFAPAFQDARHQRRPRQMESRGRPLLAVRAGEEAKRRLGGTLQ